MKNNKIALEYLILEVLEKELRENDNFLSDSEIAYRVNGISYEKKINRRAPVISKSVKDRMPKVREIADLKGMTIIADRIPSKMDGCTGLRINGWKIASKNDADYIQKELKIRELLRNGYQTSINKITKTATEKGLIVSKEKLQLE